LKNKIQKFSPKKGPTKTFRGLCKNVSLGPAVALDRPVYVPPDTVEVISGTVFPGKIPVHIIIE